VREGVTGSGGDFFGAGFKVDTFVTGGRFVDLLGSTLIEVIGAADALARNEICLFSTFSRELFLVVMVRATGFESSSVGLFPLAIRAMVQKIWKTRSKV
jgi:hypothetical protein